MKNGHYPRTLYVDKEIELTVKFVQNLNMQAIIWGNGCKGKNIVISYEHSEDVEKQKIRGTFQSFYNLGKEMTIIVTGTLAKDPTEGHTPIAGLLQNYTFEIKRLVEWVTFTLPPSGSCVAGKTGFTFFVTEAQTIGVRTCRVGSLVWLV